MQNNKEWELRNLQDPELKEASGESSESEIDLLGLMYHLVDKLPRILIVSFLCAAIVFSILYFVVTPKYQASTKLYVSGSSTGGTIENLVAGFQGANYLTNDYRQLFTNKEVHDQVLERLDLTEQYWLENENRPDYRKLETMLSITNPNDTRVLTLTVVSENEDEARDLAETYAKVAREFIEDRMESKMPSVFEKVYSGRVSKNTASNTVIAFVKRWRNTNHMTKTLLMGAGRMTVDAKRFSMRHVRSCAGCLPNT